MDSRSADSPDSSEPPISSEPPAIPEDSLSSSSATSNTLPPDDVEAIDELGKVYRALRDELSKVIIGQHEVVEQLAICLFSRGHALLMGVPGLAKTLLISSVGECMHLSFSRIQFTPDLMPADITGTDIIQESAATGKRGFEYIKGPVFANLLLADEINRAPAKTQSALLEAMQENKVTVLGRTYDLDKPFFVLATQNPIEQEGTYPLPEAQLDRFFMQIDVDYPDLAAEREILVSTTGATVDTAVGVMGAAELVEAQRLVRHVPVGESVLETILNAVRECRPETSAIPEVRMHVSWGPGPRASQALMLGVRARAVTGARLAPSVDDVLALIHPILRHRMALNFAARAEGITVTQIIDRLCETIA